MRFEGQTAIVTGAARGIGEAIARRLASDGAAVMIADVDHTSAKATAAAIGERGVAQQLDVTEPVSGTPRSAPHLTAGDGSTRWSTTPASRALRAHLGAGCRRVAAGRGHRPHRRIPGLQSRHPGHGRRRLWPHRQHCLDRRQGRQSERGSLFGRRPASLA